MIVTCEDCGAGFNFNDSMIKPTGSKVRCSKCKHVFTVFPPAAAPLERAVAAAPAPPEDSQPDSAPDSGDQALAELDSKLDDIFGEEGNGSEMADLGEMSDLDLSSAELSAEFEDGDTDDLLVELEAEGLELPDTAAVEQMEAAIDDGDLLADADDELDLGLDLLDSDDSEADLSDDELPQIDDLLDLDGEDFDLESDGPQDTNASLASGGDLADDDLDEAVELMDLDQSLEPTDDGPDLDDLDLDLDLDADFDLDDADDISEPVAESAEAVDDDLDIDEIDLSDIEEMLSGDDVALGSEGDSSFENGLDAGDIDDLDLSDFARDLDEDDVQSEVDEQMGGDDIDLDLDLDLDLGDESDPVTSEPAAEAPNDELDFTDLADMLEPDEAAEPAQAAAADPTDLELDLLAMNDDADASALDDPDLDLDSMLDGGGGSGAEEELDLTIEMDGISDDAQAAVDSQPELEFDLEADLSEPGTGYDQEDELELNLLDDDEPDFGIGDDATQAIAADVGAVTGGLAAGAQEIGATTDDFATEEFTDARDLTPESDYMSAEDAAMPPISAKPRRSRKTLAALLVGIVVILAALVLPNLLGIRIPVLSDIQIPYLSDWIGNKDKDDPGNMKIIPLGKTIDAKYVPNQNAGKLLVISGQVRNEYNHARSGIQIAGKLFNKDGSMAKSTTVYAGNMIPTLDLARLDLAKIEALLQNESGQRDSNLNVKNGRVVPFMIVFTELPEGLDEYTVEVVGSSRKK